MKPHITDKTWIRLTELSRHDVAEATAARIRARAIGALREPPAARATALVQAIERIWTDFVELPMVGVIVVAGLMWIFQGVASGRRSDQVSGVDGGATVRIDRATTPAHGSRRRALRQTSTPR